MAADHMASAMETAFEIPLDKLFIKPDLSFYNRQSELYPLSLISSDSKKMHTLVTAPTGAGKLIFVEALSWKSFLYTAFSSIN